MPSVYLPKASMPDAYEIAMPFGTFRLDLNERETDDIHYLHGTDECTFQGQTLTAHQVRQVFAERDRLSDLDSVRVMAANAARDAQLADRSSNAQRQRDNAALARRQRLTARIAWVDGEIERAQNALQAELAALTARHRQLDSKGALLERQAKNEVSRLNSIKSNAEIELLALPEL